MCNIYVNVAALGVLADPQVSSLAAQFGAEPGASLDVLTAEILKQMARKRADDIELAALEVISLTSSMDEYLQDRAKAIIEMQNQIDATKAIMADVQRASAYGKATQNYLPLASKIGLEIPYNQRALSKIPKDWTVPVATPSAATNTTTN